MAKTKTLEDLFIITLEGHLFRGSEAAEGVSQSGPRCFIA